jgi:hypothetical protein
MMSGMYPKNKKRMKKKMMKLRMIGMYPRKRKMNRTKRLMEIGMYLKREMTK